MQLDDLLALETAVWVALQAGDAEADRQSLSEDFLGVYPSGFADRSDHVGQLAKGPTVDVFTISGPRMMVVSKRDVILSYRADYKRVGPTAEMKSMFVSSLWSHRDGRWVNTFSQDTPTRRAEAATN